MKFGQVLKEVAWLLLAEHSVSYRRIQSDCDLDQDALEAVRREFIQNKRCAVDRDGEYLVLASAADAVSDPAAMPGASSQAPLEMLTPLNLQKLPQSSNSPDLVPVPTQLANASPADPMREPASAERRQLTVMFCDLVGSTDLSGRLDAENLREVVQAYQQSAAQVIEHYEGYIAQYLGDGLLVYFGYPTAHEDDGRRAVHAALGIVEGLAELNSRLQVEHGVQLAVRLGIHTGPVVVGDMGGGGRHEQLALGETPNVAARLEGLAEPNGIVVGTRTRELAGNGFVYEDLGERELKGVAERFQTWAVLGFADEGANQTDWDDSETAVPPPVLIGRDEEAGLLLRAWQSTRDEGRGQVVTINGEAGIGKSALIDGLRAELRGAGSTVITFRCSPYHANSAMYPVIEHFKRLAGWRAQDDVDARISKLEAMLQLYRQPLNETVPLFASLLSLALPEERYAPLAMTPQQQKRETQDAIIAVTLEAAEREPLLELWEDLHWADPSTLELIGLLIEQAPTVSLLMVLTGRPEFAAPWSARSHITPITLNRLERSHAEALVARLAGMKPLPAQVLDHIVTKTDGVPLYVEELTKTILASNILNETNERYELSGPLSSLEIPDTLQESLMARLDRLPQVRELAQLGSVLGREFAYEMLSGLSSVGDTVLQEGLAKLVEDELLYQRGRPPRAKYIFKHALLQDAAYASLLRRTRKQYHRQVAELLEAHFPETVETHPELLAHHLSEAGEADRAIDYFLKAGERCLRSSANAEAIAHLYKGLEVASTMPDGSARGRRELDLLMTIGPAVVTVSGYTAPEVETAYRRALALSEAYGDEEQHFTALQGLWYVSYFKDHLDDAKTLAEKLIEVAKDSQNAAPDLAAYRSLSAYRALAYTLNFLGEPKAARSHFERVVKLYDPAIHGSLVFRHAGADPGAACLTQGAWSLFALGYPDQAAHWNAKGLAMARQLAHPFTEAWALTGAAVVHQFRGEAKLVLERAEATVVIAEDKGFATYAIWGRILRAWARFEGGGGAESIIDFRNNFDSKSARTNFLLDPYWRMLQADIFGQDGQTQDALALIDDALAEVARRSERFWESELYRVRGELLLRTGNADETQAEACFQKALETSRAKEARSWELRAATSLAQLWLRQARQDEARALLAPIYAWFTEGFDTADLKQARGVLEKLDAPVSIDLNMPQQ